MESGISVILLVSMQMEPKKYSMICATEGSAQPEGPTWIGEAPRKLSSRNRMGMVSLAKGSTELSAPDRQGKSHNLFSLWSLCFRYFWDPQIYQWFLTLFSQLSVTWESLCSFRYIDSTYVCGIEPFPPPPKKRTWNSIGPRGDDPGINPRGKKRKGVCFIGWVAFSYMSLFEGLPLLEIAVESSLPLEFLFFYVRKNLHIFLKIF